MILGDFTYIAQFVLHTLCIIL